MNSDKVKAGVEHAPHRSLLKADGYNDEQMRRPFVGVVNSFNEIAPGHMHLQNIARAVKDGVLAAGGTPMEFNTIGVCDGIAMGHDGMHFSLSSRELIADTIECMVKAHCFDALVFIPNCDKIVPGMLMASGVSFPVNDLIGANSSLGFTSNSNILSNKANASNINFSNLNALGFSGTSFMPSELIKSHFLNALW